MSKDYATLWVCVDCYMTEAQGEFPDGYDENGTHETDPDRNPEPWSAIHPDDQTKLITPGLMYEEHSTYCPNFDEDGNYLGESDCNCEDNEFSWSRCDGCGSTLGGSRHAYTMHFDS